MEGPLLPAVPKKPHNLAPLVLQHESTVAFAVSSPRPAVLTPTHNNERGALIWRPRAAPIDPVPARPSLLRLVFVQSSKRGNKRGHPGLNHCRSFLLLRDTSSADYWRGSVLEHLKLGGWGGKLGKLKLVKVPERVIV